MNHSASIAQSDPATNREAELLICCATSVATPERTARARAVIDMGVDWPRVTQMAVIQAVMPIVYRYVTSELADVLPPGAAMALRRALQGNSLRNLHLSRELVRLTRLLEEGGVESLAIKGPALAVTAYGAIAMRQFSDLDLMVRKSEVVRAVEILQHQGYTPRAGFGLSDLERPGTYEIAMAQESGLIEIDLHWQLILPYFLPHFPRALPDDDLWRRAVRVEIEDGGVVRTLAPADHLLYLCAHGAKHGWEVLGGICDMAELIRASSHTSSHASFGTSSKTLSIDWAELTARAEQGDARRALGLGLVIAHDLMDAAVPAAVLETARSQAVMRAARTFIGYVRNPSDEGPGFYQRWSVPLRVIEGPMERLRYVAARALLPSADDREFLRLPPALNSLYYLLRPLRVALKEAPTALRRLMRTTPRPANPSSR